MSLNFRNRAIKMAVDAGEFDDPCVHENNLHYCRRDECRELRYDIIDTYYKRIVEASIRERVGA